MLLPPNHDLEASGANGSCPTYSCNIENQWKASNTK